MPIRSQIDTSLYGRRGREISVGDVLGIVNTIRNAAQSRRDREKLQKEEDDLKFVNSTVGKYMQGYAGNDPNDLYQRRQGAYNEILTQRPELQSYVGTRQDADMKGQFEADKNALGLQNDQVTLDNNRQVLKSNQMKNLDDETQWKMKRATDATQGLADVSDQFGFSKWRDDYSDVVGDKITPYYEDFVNSNIPADIFWRDGAGQVKQKRLADAQQAIEDRNLLVQGKEAEIANKGADTKLKGGQTTKAYADAAKALADANKVKDGEENGFSSLTGFNAPEALSYAGMAMGQFSKMKQLIDSGDAKFYERGMLGAFVNPEFKKTLDFLSNYIGRQDSGAAINKDEWKTFKGLIADRDLMMTPEGRQQVSALLGEYIGRTYNMGVMQTKGNENWYEQYKSMANAAIKQYGGGRNQQPSAANDLELIHQRRAMKNGRQKQIY